MFTPAWFTVGTSSDAELVRPGNRGPVASVYTTVTCPRAFKVSVPGNLRARSAIFRLRGRRTHWSAAHCLFTALTSPEMTCVHVLVHGVT